MNKGPIQAGASAEPPPPATANVTVKTADVSVRLGFLRKVYTLLTFNLLITIGISCIFTFVDPVRDFIVDHEWIVWASIGVAFAALITLACVRVKYPMNLILMYVFVVSFSVMIGAIVARYYESGYGIIVLQAFFATTAVFLSITAYVFVTKKDFSFLYGFLGAGLVVLIGLILMNFVWTWSTGNRSRGFTFGISLLGISQIPIAASSNSFISTLYRWMCAYALIVHLVLSYGVQALLMTGYLLFDTSMVITRYGPDDWLIAVISLYIDVTQLFLYLLNIFSFVSG